MTRAEAICQEFCDRIQASIKLIEIDDTLHEIPELKCSVSKRHFPELFKRMQDIGYECTQVQNNARFHRCIAWFEPQVNERRL